MLLIVSTNSETIHQHCHKRLTRTEDEFISARHAPGRAWRSRCHARGRARGGSLQLLEGVPLFFRIEVIDVRTVPPEITEGGAET